MGLTNFWLPLVERLSDFGLNPVLRAQLRLGMRFGSLGMTPNLTVGFALWKWTWERPVCGRSVRCFRIDESEYREGLEEAGSASRRRNSPWMRLWSSWSVFWLGSVATLKEMFVDVKLSERRWSCSREVEGIVVLRCSTVFIEKQVEDVFFLEVFAQDKISYTLSHACPSVGKRHKTYLPVM